MAPNDPFQQIWDEHSVIHDCLIVARRSILADEGSIENTQFATMKREDARARIVQRLGDIDDRTVLALWTRFERYIIEYVQQAGSGLAKTIPPVFIENLKSQIRDSIERRRFEDLLNLFKTVVNPERLGDAKNVKKYRDWIVHRNPGKGSPAKVDPTTTRRILSAVIADIRAADPGAP